MTTARNPIVFAVGCARSGTTLLQRMLDNHPELAVANDTHFILSVIDKALLGDGNDPIMTAKIVDDTLSYYRFSRLGLNEAQVRAAAENARTYSGFVSNLYDVFGSLHGKPFAGEKTPSYCASIPKLSSLFPDAKFIHLMRDGRDVALSVLEWADRRDRKRGPARLEFWEQDPLATTALWWSRSVRRAMEGADLLGPDLVLTLHHRELVADSEGSTRRVCDFLGLRYSDAMARYYEGKENPGGTGSAKRRWLRPTPGLRDWRTQMSVEDREVFSGLAGDVLEVAGYDPERSAAGDSANRRINAARAWSLNHGALAGTSFQTA
ncbi:MAG TPA: sulfotransferase [Rhodothermales bacterium]|nr:sulfotransferase [Rhodothermales bacterium]